MIYQSIIKTDLHNQLMGLTSTEAYFQITSANNTCELTNQFKLHFVNHIKQLVIISTSITTQFNTRCIKYNFRQKDIRYIKQ